MGTRADFYVGKGESAEWIGSIAWDGYPNGIDESVLKAETKEQFIWAVAKFFDKRDDVTLPAQGWPWPWDDSCTTDYAYAFFDGSVKASCFGHKWHDPIKSMDLEDDELDEFIGGDEAKIADFPNMRDKQNVAFDNRSGAMFI